MRTVFGMATGLVLMATPALAQDYSTSSSGQARGQWDYSSGSQSSAPRGESYEGYPPPPTQVIISPGMGGGYGSYGGSGSSNGSSPQGGGQGGGQASGTMQGGVGWGNTGGGGVGYGNIGAGNTGMPSHGGQ
ncbi:hypothetical protein GOB81_10770 [Acetobacter sp. LMG 1627]|uniref:Uncharacterized protein n=2 Tax=Acetobacter conturbans TaxID=1737472 RepID=A0ABX0K6S0_9PROT|nr:hypothetical protein [Acetobacter conturbans]